MYSGLLLSHDYTSFRLTILINPRRSLIYYSYSWLHHCNAVLRVLIVVVVLLNIERCDCR